MSDDYESRLRAVLSDHGIRDFHFERRRRHRAVVVAHAGRTITIVFPTSGSDWRGPHRCAADLRRELRKAIA
jgi:hypothetical protein